MASNVTLLRMIEDARLFADQRRDEFIDNTGIARLINHRARQIYDLLVEARGSEYYAAEGTISIVPSVSRYPLPADFYQLSSVTLEWGDQDHEPVEPIISHRERTPYFNAGNWSRYDSKAYKLRASQIEFLPTPTSPVTCRLQYVPAFTDLVNDNDTFDGINGWEKAIVVGAAIDMTGIDKRPQPHLTQAWQEAIERIESLKSERDAEHPKYIIDVNPDGRRGARLLGLSPWDDTFDSYFGK